MSKHKANIIRLRKQGKSYHEIEKELECSKGTIAYHCKQDGLENIEKKQKKIDEETKEKINSLRRKKNNVESVAKKLNISESTVVKYTTEETKNKINQPKTSKKKSRTKKEFKGSKSHKGFVAKEEVRSKLVKLGYKIYEPVIIYKVCRRLIS